MNLFRRILVPSDLDAPSRAALGYAVELGRATGAELSVLHVEPPPATTLRSLFDRAVHPGRRAETDTIEEERDASRLATLERFVRGIPRVTELRVRLVLRHGLPEEEVASCAREDGMDLIVLGVDRPVASLAHQLASGRSLAERLLRRPPCPVLIVRSEPPLGADSLLAPRQNELGELAPT